MRQSNGYVIGFIVAMTVLCAGALAGVNEMLKERIATQRSLDTKKKILSTVIPRDKVATKSDAEIEEFYSNNISGIVVNNVGDKLESEDPNKVKPRSVFKEKDPSKKLLPVFIYANSDGKNTYVLPLYGLGLWDEIWGYVALAEDGNTIKGIVLDHKAETPGLGARITEEGVQKRFLGKPLFDEEEETVLHIIKGESNPDVAEYEVDGLSGATMTTVGVNNMLEAYYNLYKPYLNSL